ncbi:hypothetical protein MPER_05157, partial [Moniliophthora perniciosa FA553]
HDCVRPTRFTWDSLFIIRGRRIWIDIRLSVKTAGLKRNNSHKEYNVHVLCTSNIAGPLEMLDGITNQLE